MINIDTSTFVGKGHHREVYRHPDDPSLCIKIVVDDDYDEREINREINYYRHLKKRKVSWDMLSQYHGDVTTNLGLGSVFSLITDPDGNVSKTLGYYLLSNVETEKHYDDLLNALVLFKEYLLKERIITKSLAHRNIVCERNELGIVRLHLVDNIGNAEFIPLCNYITFLGKKKVLRKWKRFEQKLLQEFPNNEALHRIITKLNS